MFSDANDRCVTEGVELSAHPHLLRHTFAVVTLEQLQRGHIASLSGLTSSSGVTTPESSEIRWTGCDDGWATGRW